MGPSASSLIPEFHFASLTDAIQSPGMHIHCAQLASRPFHPRHVWCQLSLCCHPGVQKLALLCLEHIVYFSNNLSSTLGVKWNTAEGDCNYVPTNISDKQLKDSGFILLCQFLLSLDVKGKIIVPSKCGSLGQIPGADFAAIAVSISEWPCCGVLA